ncbi:MAG: hypothetical protein IPM52_00885 [Bacteroidetes bacterium]|nr:hypothetical protein [Bacteroidota bacterium]
MKKLAFYLIALFVLPTLVFTGCKKENENPVDTQKILTDYLVQQDLDLNKIIQGFVFDTPDNVDAVANRYIIDIRTPAEYAQGHIQGAVRVDLKDILTEAAKAGDKQILVVCKTGQTATFAVSLLRLSGYKNAQALKWGMSRWNATFDVWSQNIGNIAQNSTNWTNEAAPTNVTYEAPKFSDINTTDPAEILRLRVQKVLNDGFKTVTPDALLNDPNAYFVNNYFPEADYLAFGHVKNARRINPLLITDESVKYLDPSKPIATYCYTGQTSGAITAWLRVLGYDAYSVLWGMNRFYNGHSHWTSNKWSPGMVKNLPFVQ